MAGIFGYRQFYCQTNLTPCLLNGNERQRFPVVKRMALIKAKASRLPHLFEVFSH